MTAVALPNTDRGGFEAAVLPLRPVLYRRALHLCRDPQGAEDLVQDTVMRAWRFWPSFRQGTNCAAWLKTILHHIFINGCRRRGRERRLLSAVREVQAQAADGHGARPVDAFDQRLGDEVLAALSELPMAFREVLLLVDVDGLSYQEAADRIERPVGTVMSRLHRARRLMRGGLQGYAAEHGYGSQQRSSAA